MKDWDNDFFHRRLQQTIKSLFRTELEIFRNDADAPAGKAYIANRYLGDGGDPYSGTMDFGEVELMNFNRPNTGMPLQIKLSYTQSTLSGQMDLWIVTATGVLESEKEFFGRVFEPGGYGCFYPGNNLEAEIKILS